MRPEVSLQIREAYERDKPLGMKAIEEWAEALAPQLGVTPKSIVQDIRDEANVQIQTMRTRAETWAESLANQAGATLFDAFATLKDGLHAVKRKPVLDRQGQAVLDPETGKAMVLETPDYANRISAAKEIMRVFPGAIAPQQIDVREQTLNLNLDLSDGKAVIGEIQGALAELQRLEQDIRSRSAGVIECAPQEAGVAGQVSGPGQLLLADGMHEDQGRARSAEPVQAVPEPKVHKARSRLSRKRADGDL